MDSEIKPLYNNCTLVNYREPAKVASRGLCANLIHSIDVKNITICNEIG